MTMFTKGREEKNRKSWRATPLVRPQYVVPPQDIEGAPCTVVPSPIARLPFIEKHLEKRAALEVEATWGDETESTRTSIEVVTSLTSAGDISSGTIFLMRRHHNC